ncbi:non-ribosomal peptide synthetase [Cellulomonas sp. B6]|uniref:non-ribosomal peptide synthetase n=1 Tax=Cellulomonas sp. B6 TaxID=1295626 RepID=UPI00073C636E|nr:non-ribosomal peptide synthetase [Cellulomonas sp. B6]KSW23744.1 hypothetical protein ATM99_12625 [Cellulomonas sp. B6]
MTTLPPPAPAAAPPTAARGAARALTAAQRTIWFDEAFSDGVLHTMGDHLDVTGPLDVPTLRRTFAQLVREAQTLRAAPSDAEGGPVQTVRDDLTVPLEVVDLRAHGDGAHAAALAASRAEQDRRFDLATPPLVRATLYVLGPERHLCHLTMHHLLCDGWSRVPLYARLAAIYRGLLAGEDVTAGALPPLAVLLDAEEAYARSAAHAADARFWQARASALGDPLTLSQEPASAGRAHLRRSATLPPARAAALRRAAREADVTWAGFAIAGVGAYLAGAAGSGSATLTLPVTARVGPRTRAVPGMVANYLPLRVDASPRVTRGQLLQQVARDVLATVAHQRYRAEDVRRAAGLPAGDRRGFGPYVNVLPQAARLDMGPARATLHNLSTGIVDDLMVTVLDAADGGLELHLNGNPARYTAAELASHAAGVADHLERLAAAAGTTPLGRVPAVPHAAPSAPHDDAGVHLGPRRAPRAPDGVVERVRRAAARDGAAAAVVDERGVVDYTALVRHADGVARAVLPDEGGSARGRVGALLAAPGRDVVAGVLGLLGAGAAFVPLDVRAPAARCAALLADCGADVLLVDAAGRARVDEVLALLPAPARPRVVDLADAQTPAGTPPLPVRGGPDDVAYVLFTSGTTGRPKGAMVHRGGLLNHLDAKQDLLGLVPADRVVQNAPLTFDVAIWQMLAPLVVGASVRCVPPATAADPDALAAVVADDAVTVLEVVPSLLRATLDLWGTPGPQLASLRWLMVTGEALPVDLAHRWTSRHPAVPLVNAYGPTECSDDVAHAVVTGSTPPGRRTPVGVPIRNTSLWVLGPGLAPVHPGAVGELYVGGEAVGAGYLGDPARTARTFVADPFGAPGARLYRTGDHVRWTPDGQLEFVERRDHQVKVRGQRVELGEIEAVLRSLEGVDDAAVLARARAGLTRLDAYVVGARARADLDALRREVTTLLPEHMVPAGWLALDALPLTPHGKVDRAALGATPAPHGEPAPHHEPAPHGRGAAAAPTTVAGAGAAVEDVRRVLAEVLAQPDVGPDDDFFAVGGDSIAAIQVVSALRRRGRVTTPRAVFELGTARAIAHASGSTTRPGPAASAAPPAVRVVEPWPAAADLAASTGDVRGVAASYGQATVLAVPAALDADSLTRVLTAVLAVHPLLGLRVQQTAPGVWTHRTGPAGTAADVAARVRTAPPDADVAAEVTAAGTRLSPADGVVWQAVLLPGVRPRLLLALHHLVVDGVSWRVLRDELSRAWDQHLRGEPVVVEPEATGFADFVAAQGAATRAGALDDEVVTWRAVDADADAPRPDARHVHRDACRVGTALGTDVTAALVTTCPARYRADINDLLLGALAVALADVARARGGRPLATTVELEGHGREELPGHPGLDVGRTVGWFTSTFPVALPTSGPATPGASRADTLTAAVKAVHQQLRTLPRHGSGHGALRHQHPQGHLLLGADVPALGFNYLGRFATDAARAPWEFEPLGPAGAVATTTDPGMPLRHALAVTATTEDGPDGPRLVAEWLHAPDLVPGDEVRAVATAWEQALVDLVATADRPANRVPVPADVPLVDVTDADLHAFAAHEPGTAVLDVLPLSPLQRGMLLHAQPDDARPDPYLLQVAADLVGPLDADRLGAALDAAVAADPVLGGQVLFTAAGSPVLVLREGRHVPLPTTPGDPEVLAARDLRERFDLAGGPAVRTRLVPLGPDRHRLVLTLHHVLVDGWSMPLLVEDLLARHAGTTPAPRPPARRVLAHLARHDGHAATAVWRAALDGVDGPTLVAPAPRGAAPAAGTVERTTVDLDDAATARVTAWARAHGVTVTTVVLVAWASVLATVTGRRDVLLGTTVSTRPADVAGVEDTIGMFLATLPVRVRHRADEDAAALVRRVQAELAELREHAHVPLGPVLAGVPGLAGSGEAFDTTVVVENFPTGESVEGRTSGGLRVERARTHDARHFPLSLVAVPGRTLALRVEHQPDRVGRPDAARVVASLHAALDDLVADAVPAALRAGTAADAPVAPRPARPGPAPARAAAPRADTLALAGAESLVRAAFAQVLGHAEVGPDDNFFLLGGDSIAAIHVVAALRAHGLQVAPPDLFTHRTPAALAAALPGAAPTAPSPRSAEPLLATPTAAELDELDSELGF